ncbi:MAG: F0F1 ATP synthase subunit delta, partial [Planctomycetes bacterium]|nr:F0F1 ATP synthase subunit delta [Planctomycetota bacterium]
MTLLAKRYASALFTLAKDKGAVDAVAGDLIQLHGELHAPGAA